jgi:hypothetical protein
MSRSYTSSPPMRLHVACSEITLPLPFYLWEYVLLVCRYIILQNERHRCLRRSLKVALCPFMTIFVYFLSYCLYEMQKLFFSVGISMKHENCKNGIKWARLR